MDGQLLDRIDLDQEPARRLAQAIAVTRVALGAVGLVAPRLITRPWVGRNQSVLAQRMLGRAVAGRDLALGLGAVLSLERGHAPVRGWMEAGALADAADLVVSVIEMRRSPTLGRLLFIVGAGGGALAGVLTARRVDGEPALG